MPPRGRLWLWSENRDGFRTQMKRCLNFESGSLDHSLSSLAATMHYDFLRNACAASTANARFVHPTSGFLFLIFYFPRRDLIATKQRAHVSLKLQLVCLTRVNNSGVVKQNFHRKLHHNTTGEASTWNGSEPVNSVSFTL